MTEKSYLSNILLCHATHTTEAAYFLARSAKLPEGLYILPMFFLYFFLIFFIFFLVVAPGATLAQKPMVRSSPKFQDW